jgi:hypothetical protein
MGIPIFIPTLEFFMKLNTLEDNKPMKSCAVSDDGHDIRISRLAHSPGDTANNDNSGDKSAQPAVPSLPKNSNSAIAVNPESVDAADTAFWIKKTPYYQWPHINYFSSWDNLMHLLNNTNWKSVHEGMIQENHKRFATSR